jgi:hypothetical protein
LRLTAWISWAAAVVWLVLVLFGAIEFQELYGGSSGLQVVLLGLVVGMIPASLGWRAFRSTR